MGDTCEYHVELVKDIATIKSDIAYIKDNFSCHIKDAEKDGGFRDRLLLTETRLVALGQEISLIKKGYWINGIIGGLIGGLLATSAPETFKLIGKLVFK